MTTPKVPSQGEVWAATLSNLAKAYGQTEDETAVAVYAVAEQVHQHYCLSRGIVNHQESRPDQHVAISILGSLAATDWWLARSAALRPALEALEPEARFLDDAAEGGFGPMAD